MKIVSFLLILEILIVLFFIILDKLASILPSSSKFKKWWIKNVVENENK